MTPATLPEEAGLLLRALFPDDVMTGDLRINFRGLVHDDGAPDDAVSRFVPSVATLLHSDGVARELRAWNHEQRRSVYVAPGIRRGRDGTKAGVAALTALFADLDAKDFLGLTGQLTPAQRAEGKRLARQRLRERLPEALQPSIIIDSGGGLQCWWLFKEPAWLGGDDYTVETLEGYLKGLAQQLGGDPAVAQLAALMRLPGFRNRKYPEAPDATILAADLSRQFNPSDFAEFFLDLPASTPRLDDAPTGTPGPLAPVLATCTFLQWCRDHPADVREPLWYSALSNLVRLEGGREAAHAVSRGHPGYSPAETDQKLDHALAASGPISCAKIQALGFRGCPADGHGVKSPAGLAWKRPAEPAPPASTAEATPAAPLRFRQAADILDDPPPASIVGGIAWAGCLTTLVSEPGVGKTFVLLDVGAAVSDARPWHGRPVRPGAVAYVSFEGDALGLRLLGLREAGAPLAQLYLLRARDPLSPRVDREGVEWPSPGEQALADALADLASRLAEAGAPPLRLLVLDTIRASLTGSEDRSEDVSAYLRAVRRLLAPHPTAGALLAHHAGWQDGDTQRKRERGSSAFRGNIDATLYIEVTDENRELGCASLTLTARKVRDDARPAPLRLVRSRLTVPRVDETGRPYTTCRIETDPRSREDLDVEQAHATGVAQAALDQQAEAFIARGAVTSVAMLRALLAVSKPTADAVLARLLLAGRVRAPGRQRAPYTLVSGESDRVRPSRTRTHLRRVGPTRPPIGAVLLARPVVATGSRTDDAGRSDSGEPRRLSRCPAGVPSMMIPRCSHAGRPCLCRAAARLRRQAQAVTPPRPRRTRRPSPPAIPVRRVADRAPAPTYVLLHATPPRRDGTCPACARPFDDGHCAVLRATGLRSNVLGLVALSHVACLGTPGPWALPLAESRP